MIHIIISSLKNMGMPGFDIMREALDPATGDDLHQISNGNVEYAMAA